jgi:hypothetical protein
MAESIRLSGILFLFIVPLFAAFWVWQDAHRLRENGADITPWLWTALVLLTFVLSFPAYLCLRLTTWRTSISPPLTTAMDARAAGPHQLRRPDRTELIALYWIVSLLFAVMLSMYATWIAISRYPIPDSNAIDVALLLVFFIVLLDLVLLGDLMVVGLRKGKQVEAVTLAGIFVGGFLLAAVVGLLTWGIGWFIADRPWVPQAFYIIAGMILPALQRWWFRRKSKGPWNPEQPA